MCLTSTLTAFCEFESLENLQAAGNNSKCCSQYIPILRVSPYIQGKRESKSKTKSATFSEYLSNSYVKTLR